MRKCGGKRRWRDEIAAKLAMATAVRKRIRPTDRDEQRVYPCGRCGGWHVTSMPRAELQGPPAAAPGEPARASRSLTGRSGGENPAV